ncbi:hypothetical protein [Microbispora sp. H10836]|uniref:hypothetical protein n=1 Tax=Microbispora sp. H10836 TaxID=2729106 RepID=UPI0014744AA8|nr:hypothetical protein [Microbispora sp. H10836]
MNLQAQIELITVPQDFTRLCNAVLRAEYGDDFLPIDDDRPDRGNDGYLKSEKRIFAAHCFKRIQNRGLDSEIYAKMSSDLKKAIALKGDGNWEVRHWTFLSNYPIPEAIASRILKAGRDAGIEVSWRGPDYFAGVLQRFKSVRELFPNLLANDIMWKLEEITEQIESLRVDQRDPVVTWVPRNPEEQQLLISQAPPAWEYLLFAGSLLQGKERLEGKWRDFQMGYGRRNGVYLDDKSAVARLGGVFGDALVVGNGIKPIFDERAQEEAFGPPGVPGDPGKIVHFAGRIISTYEDLLDWASDIRGTVYPEEMRHAAELAARVADRPARDIRDFVDRVVEEYGRIPQWLEMPNRGRLEINLTLELSVDDAAIEACMKEYKRACRRMRI